MDSFIAKARKETKAKFGRSPKVYDVVISDGSRKISLIIKQKHNREKR